MKIGATRTPALPTDHVVDVEESIINVEMGADLPLDRDRVFKWKQRTKMITQNLLFYSTAVHERSNVTRNR